MKSTLALLMLVLITSCSTMSDMARAPKQSGIVTYQNNSIDVSESPTVLLRIKDDSGQFAENISRRIESLGFTMVKDTRRPDYYAEVEYKTYFDVLYNTFTFFDIAFLDAKTNVIKFRLRYVGGLRGFNDCDDALDLLFQEASRYAKKRT